MKRVYSRWLYQFKTSARIKCVVFQEVKWEKKKPGRSVAKLLQWEIGREKKREKNQEK